jgi:hypothetical protein
MISTASRATLARSHQFMSKSKSALYSTCLVLLKNTEVEKSKMKNVRGCINPLMAINQLKDESVKTLLEYEFKPTEKLMSECMIAN